MGPPDKGRKRGGKCPICGAPTEHRYRPFCSARCADIDLARWLNGTYAVPVVEPDEGDLDEIEDPGEGSGMRSGDDGSSGDGR